MRNINPHIPFIELVSLIDQAKDPEIKTQTAEFAVGTILNTVGPVMFFEVVRRLLEERGEAWDEGYNHPEEERRVRCTGPWRTRSR